MGFGGGGSRRGGGFSAYRSLHNIEKQREIKSFVLVFSFFVAMCRPGWGSVGTKTGEVGGKRLQDFFETLFTTCLIFVCVSVPLPTYSAFGVRFFSKFVVDMIF